MVNPLVVTQNSKGLLVQFDCPHCYASIKIEYNNPGEMPEFLFCPTCGEREETRPLNLDDPEYDYLDDEWDE